MRTVGRIETKVPAKAPNKTPNEETNAPVKGEVDEKKRHFV